MKQARDVMTPGSIPEAELRAAGSIAASVGVDQALGAVLERVERGAERVAVTDGRDVVGSVTPGPLAISIEDTRTWGSLCK